MAKRVTLTITFDADDVPTLRVKNDNTDLPQVITGLAWASGAAIRSAVMLAHRAGIDTPTTVAVVKQAAREGQESMAQIWIEEGGQE